MNNKLAELIHNHDKELKISVLNEVIDLLYFYGRENITVPYLIGLLKIKIGDIEDEIL